VNDAPSYPPGCFTIKNTFLHFDSGSDTGDASSRSAPAVLARRGDCSSQDDAMLKGLRDRDMDQATSWWGELSYVYCFDGDLVEDSADKVDVELFDIFSEGGDDDSPSACKPTKGQRRAAKRKKAKSVRFDAPTQALKEVQAGLQVVPIESEEEANLEKWMPTDLDVGLPVGDLLPDEQRSMSEDVTEEEGEDDFVSENMGEEEDKEGNKGQTKVQQDEQRSLSEGVTEEEGEDDYVMENIGEEEDKEKAKGETKVYSQPKDDAEVSFYPSCCSIKDVRPFWHPIWPHPLPEGWKTVNVNDRFIGFLKT